MSKIHTPGSSRERMLSAALSLFAEQGFVQTSTAHVARDAGTSESQLIKHFGSKEGLLQALFDAVWERFNADIAQLAGTLPDPVQRLRAIVALLLTRFAANSSVRRLLLFEGRRIQSRGAAVSAGFVRFVETIDVLLKEAKAAGRLRVLLAPAAIRSLLIGACEGMVRDRQLAQDGIYPTGYSFKDVEQAMEALMSTFFNDAPSRQRTKLAIGSRRSRTRRAR